MQRNVYEKDKRIIEQHQNKIVWKDIKVMSERLKKILLLLISKYFHSIFFQNNNMYIAKLKNWRCRPKKKKKQTNLKQGTSEIIYLVYNFILIT